MKTFTNKEVLKMLNEINLGELRELTCGSNTQEEIHGNQRTVNELERMINEIINKYNLRD